MLIAVDKMGFMTVKSSGGIMRQVQIGHIATVTGQPEDKGCQLLISGQWMTIFHPVSAVFEAMARWYDGHAEPKAAETITDPPKDSAFLQHPGASVILAEVANERGCLFPWQKEHSGLLGLLSRVWEAGQGARPSLAKPGGYADIRGAREIMDALQDQPMGADARRAVEATVQRVIRAVYEIGCDENDARQDREAGIDTGPLWTETPESAWSRGWRAAAQAIANVTASAYRKPAPYASAEEVVDPETGETNA